MYVDCVKLVSLYVLSHLSSHCATVIFVGSINVFALISFSIRLIIETVRINKYNKNDKEYRKENDEITGFSGELVRGAKDIKMLNGESSFLNELKNKFVSLNFMHYKKESTNLIYLLFRWIWAELSYFIMIVIVAISVNNEQISIPVGVVIFNFGNRYNMLVGYIINFYELIKKFNLSATRIFEIFKSSKYEKETFGEEHLSKIDGNFEFKNVSFKYPDADEYLLKNISFKANKGETVAFIGSTGSGKSTLINLVPRFYDATEGEVLVDGVNVKDYTQEFLHNKIGYVPQKAVMFNGTVNSNIAYGDNGKGEISEEKIKKAIEVAQGKEFVEKMNEKYDTHIAQGGTNVSGGQKQRLAIARAIARNPEIYIFDDSFSALDYKTDSLLRKALKEYTKDATSLIVAQRIGTIMNADKIIVLDNGESVGVGTHKELLKTCDVYKEIALSQLKEDELNA